MSEGNANTNGMPDSDQEAQASAAAVDVESQDARQKALGGVAHASEPSMRRAGLGLGHQFSRSKAWTVEQVRSMPRYREGGRKQHPGNAAGYLRCKVRTYMARAARKHSCLQCWRHCAPQRACLARTACSNPPLTSNKSLWYRASEQSSSLNLLTSEKTASII